MDWSQTGSAAVLTSYPTHPDQWEEISLEEHEINPERLDEAFDYAFLDGTFTQAVVVIKDGKLMREKYRGMSASEANLIAESTGTDAAFWLDEYGYRDHTSEVTSWSTAKSFTSFLIGIAIEDGFLGSIDDPASEYIDEWIVDDRSSITIKSLLDMRSGLVPICYDWGTLNLGTCKSFQDARSGGNLVYSDDQLSACINRPMATAGEFHPWLQDSVPYELGDFVYSNCDTMVLGEILYRATGKDLQIFANEYLFSKIEMSASWWRDNAADGQADGNYLAYCCLDSTARDFAKFGHLFILGGIWEGEKRSYQDYVSEVLALTDYGLQFWTFCANAEQAPCTHTIITTIGFDGQYIMIDTKNDIVAVRTSLYDPVENYSLDRKMRLNPNGLSDSNWTASVPNGVGAQLNSTFYYQEFYRLLQQAILP